MCVCVCVCVCVVAEPNGTKILDWVPQFTCILGQEYPTMGGPKDGEAVSIGDRRKFFFLFGFLSCIPTILENVTMWLAPPYKIRIGLLSPREVIFLTTIVFLSPQFFPPPTLYPSVFIYRLLLVGSSWWEGSFPCWWVPMSYIPNQIGPTACDWYDSLETCTICQLMLSKQIPPRHYPLISV